jgi:hypothetical protein
MRLGDWREIEAIRTDLGQYRVRAVSLLRKYFKMSVELGRLPSLLGREFFRTQVTSYTTHTFEDAVIFVHDMERAVEALTPASQRVIVRVIFQAYTYDEAASLLQIPRRSFVRHVASALDELSRILLDRELMEPVHDPLSAYDARRDSDPEGPVQMAPVSIDFLRSLAYPKMCQAQKFAKIRASR